MYLEVLQDHKTRLPNGEAIAAKAGTVIAVEDPVGEFLIRDGQGKAFRVTDAPPDSAEAAALAAKSADGDDDAHGGLGSAALKDRSKKELLDDVITPRWGGLEGINMRSTHREMLEAIDVQVAKDGSGQEKTIEVVKGATSEGQPLLVGHREDGDPIHVATVVDADGNVSIDLSGLSDEQRDAVEAYELPVDGLASLVMGDDIVSLVGGIADGRQYFVQTLAADTLSRFLLEINPDMDLEDLDRDALLNTIRDLEDESEG